MDLSDVTGQTLLDARFEDKDFEQLFRRLLEAERALRHRPDAKLKGPVARYRGDDQRDLTFEPKGPVKTPREQFTAALTWDDLSITWYSCKGGGSWRSDILDELGQAKYNEFKKSGKAPGQRVQKRPPDTLLEHLAHGGRYVFVVASPEINDRGSCDAASDVLAFWLDQTGRIVPTTLRQQLEFIDGNEIADFIATHRPTEEQCRKLGASSPPGLLPWSLWTTQLTEGRDPPPFEHDDLRDAVLAAIADPQIRIVRVFGPPGIGKTRLVHEGIVRSGIEHASERVRFSQDADVGRRLVQDGWVRDHGGPVYLVLDELRSIDVDAIHQKFDQTAHPDARLFMIGTSDEFARILDDERLRSFELGPLDDAHLERIVRTEGPSLGDEQVAAIRHLAEGFPWYAVLLARAVAKDDQVLVSGNDDATRWSVGALRVLAGNPQHHADERKWKRVAELRAKALFVAMLTRHLELDWDTLWERHGEALRLAIEEPRDWQEVKRCEKECRDRQLLRTTGATRRYVSPNNLARLILHHFLTDPDLGPTIRRHAAHLREGLLSLARAVKVDPAILERLARGEWEELARRARYEGCHAVDTYLTNASIMVAAAVEQPELAAQTITRVLAGLGDEQLASAGNTQNAATWVLVHLLRRRLSADAFVEVEQALLRLTAYDTGSFSNHARGTWRSLFWSAAHHTHMPWALRLERLDAALGSPDPARRRLAIDAIVGCVESREQGVGYTEQDLRDGEWPLVSDAVARQQKAQLWVRLLAACEREDELGEVARKGVAQRLRAGVGRGLFAEQLLLLTGQVSRWRADQRVALLEAIADLRRYDLDELSGWDELLAGIDALERAAAPTSLNERVRAQIGSWHPGPWPITDPARREHEAAGDLSLAHALLDDPATLAWALAWTRTPEAYRGAALWYALGCVDTRACLTEQLPQVASEIPGLVASYLLGWAKRADASAVERWLREAPRALVGRAALRWLAQQAPTSERLRWMAELVEQGSIDGWAFVGFVRGGWLDLHEPELLVDLAMRLGDLASKGEPEPVLVESAMGLLAALLEHAGFEPQRERLLDSAIPMLMHGLRGRIPTSTQRAVLDLVVQLAASGRAEVVARLLLTALDETSNMHLGYELLDALVAKRLVEPLWPHLSAALESRRDGHVLAWQLAGHGLLGALPEAMVLAWVGHDQRRARIIASLTSPHGPTLAEIVRVLLVQFGDEGAVADVLRSRALSMPGASVGFMTFERRQLEHARAWQADPAPQVQRWARTIEATLAAKIDEHEASREFRRKYG